MLNLLDSFWEDVSSQIEEMPREPTESECHHHDEEHLYGLKLRRIAPLYSCYFPFVIPKCDSSQE